MTDPGLGVVGLVAIGRNEGERLRACLASVVGRVAQVVYVDSGSTDGSVALAQGMGVHVVALDMAVPFTAARARNEGLQALARLRPGLAYVQLVDGDCEVVDGWLEAAQAFLATHPQHAVVCGRRRERYPDRSVYNRLCDIEWDTPVGEARACGGDAMMRLQPVLQVGGYRADLIAGEEPELCIRLRQAGWRVHRLDREMTLHDAAITRFAQWWQRTKRGGHAFAEGAWLHGATAERHWVKETLRAIAWGGLLPFACVVAVAVWGLSGLWLALIYPLQWLRLFFKQRRQALPGHRALLLLLGKLAECAGCMQFYANRLLRRSAGLIEYK